MPRAHATRSERNLLYEELMCKPSALAPQAGAAVSAAVKRVVAPTGPHLLAGKVVAGFGRGSKQLGWPTANLCPSAFEKKLDDDMEGVYAGWVRIVDPSLSGDNTRVHKVCWRGCSNPAHSSCKSSVIECGHVYRLTHDSPLRRRSSRLVGIRSSRMRRRPSRPTSVTSNAAKC